MKEGEVGIRSEQGCKRGGNKNRIRARAREREKEREGREGQRETER